MKRKLFTLLFAFAALASFQLNAQGGHWASIGDFQGISDDEGCRYIQLKYVDPADGTTKVLSVSNTTGTASHSVFSVKEVDYVLRTGNSGVVNNIFAYASGATMNWSSGLSSNIGTNGYTATGTPATYNGVEAIPLFVFATPEDECKVLSVARENDFSIQTEQDGVHGNKLEVREYGRYYIYDAGVKKYYNGLTQGANYLAMASSLQKFAVWVDDKGGYTLYPCASYLWKYGVDKKTQNNTTANPSTSTHGIVQNSCLQVNSPDCRYYAYSTWEDATAHGTKIGWWNGKATDPTKNVTPYVGTVPSYIQTTSDFKAVGFTPACAQRLNEIPEGRFYYLEVTPKAFAKDTTGLWTWLAGTDSANACIAGMDLTSYYNQVFGLAAYQANRTYVISTQVDTTGIKKAILLPKEKVRRYATGADYNYSELEAKTPLDDDSRLPDYWSNNPFDSINMSAHWEFIKVEGGYILRNELGDTLQYNLPTNGVPATDDGTAFGSAVYPDNLKWLAGGELRNGYAIYDRAPNTSAPAAKQYPANPVLYGDSTLSVWSTFQLPKGVTFSGFPTAGDNAFFLSLNAPAPWSISLVGEDVTAGAYNIADAIFHGWYQGPVRSNLDSVVISAAGKITGLKPGVTVDALYFQKDLILELESSEPVVEYQGETAPTCGGLLVNLVPVYYEQKFAGSYDNEDTNAVINGNDADFKDLTMAQDSLMSYLWLHGVYGIQEAKEVLNDLYLWNTTNEYGASFGDLARLKAGENAPYEFLPYETTARPEILQSLRLGTNVENLYGETYKWFIVRDKNTGYYLTLDTINLTTLDNTLKIGFIFQNTDIANALPVRLYQPLVGDKIDGNFIFQFYVPQYNFVKNATTGAYTRSNTAYPTISGVTRGKIAFGKLAGNQSDIIVPVGDRAKATRFTYKFVGPGPRPDDPCEEVCSQFISPDWMVEERLLGQPLDNDVWWNSGGVSVPTRATIGRQQDNARDSRLQAIQLEKNADGSLVPSNGVYTPLIHTYYTSIQGPSDPNPGSLVFLDNNWKTAANKLPVTSSYYDSIPGFAGETAVPLYYVTTQVGSITYFLTVADTTYQYISQGTPNDVHGVNLVWVRGSGSSYDTPYIRDQFGANTFDARALQLFAIVGCESKKEIDDVYHDARLEWGEFVYLPLASYKAIYKDHAVDKSAIYYNLGLGKLSEECPNAVDIDDVWRVAQWSETGSTVKNLIVAKSTETNYIPGVEIKWAKQSAYILPDCHHYQIADMTKSNKQYLFTDAVGTPTGPAYAGKALPYRADLHWAATIDGNEDDPWEVTFLPELYGQELYTGYTSTNNALPGHYYLINGWQNTSWASGMAGVLNWDNVTAANNYNVTPTLMMFKCIGDHESPYYEIPEELWQSVGVALLETPYLDRALGDKYSNVSGSQKYTTPVYYGTGTSRKVIAYRTYLEQISDTETYKDAAYLTVYGSNVRSLEACEGHGQHKIPYFAFSLTEGGNTYFLGVGQKTASTGLTAYASKVDSAYWFDPTVKFPGVTLAQFIDKIVNWQDDEFAYNDFKFCLPYKLDASGNLVTEIPYPTNQTEITHKPFYLLSLDKPKEFPYFVVAGAATSYGTAVRLDAAVLTTYSTSFWSTTGLWGMDYSQIDPIKVTSWIIGPAVPASGNEWMPLKQDPEGIGVDVDGLLNVVYKTSDYLDNESCVTDPNLSGLILGASGQTPSDYGQFTSKLEPALHFEWRGTTNLKTTFGNYPIWYYAIKAGDKYLTDATPEGSGDNWFNYTQSGAAIPYPHAYFGAVKATTTDATTSIKSDAGFVQTFGFKYIDSDKSQGECKQYFYVVSNVDYKAPKPADYRYLGEVGHRAVFLKGQDAYNYATVFKFGRAKDGSFVDIQAVGTGNVFGVDGGVRLLNVTGKVDIYTINGSLVKSAVLNGGDQTIAAPRGVVLVKVGAKVTKVVVK
ncbi:MAG: hypothetical protein LBR64_09445 [Dysgonamonadaceae bacterium]|jgi:hypothetical protein|nr:hypothetical protein [Dysgonamonadaceae bacterium]